MKTAELRNLDNEKLYAELLSVRRAQYSFRVQLATQQAKDTSQAKKLRHQVARIKTIQHERVLGK